MGSLALLFQVAFRNLFKSKVNIIIGCIIFFPSCLVVTGGALLDSIDSSMSRSIIGSLSGHIQVYSDRSKEELALFGVMGGEADVAALDSFTPIKAALEKHPNVKTVVPMGTNGALISSGNTVDLTLARLRDLYRAARTGGETPELRARIDSLKSHVRHLAELLQSEPGFRKVIQIREGKLDDLKEPGTILIFEEQAKKLEVKVGDTMTLSAPTMRGTNNTLDVRVVAIATNVGMMSAWNTFVPSKSLRDLCQLKDDATGALYLYLKDMKDIPAVPAG